MARDTLNSCACPLTFLVQACQHLWFVLDYGLYQVFTYVDHVGDPCPLPD